MWLLAGLGNPGDKYEHHRHNIGFIAADRIASDFSFPAYSKKFQGLVTEGRIADQKVVLLKPMTFMNLSGQAVGEAVKYYKIDADRIIIFHDELDLAPSKVRVKCGGGTGGHNGLKSIQSHLSTPDFWRVRMGIGHPGDKERVHGYVLSDFAKAEQGWVDDLCNACSRHLPLLLEQDMDGYMTKVSQDITPPRNKKEQTNEL